MSGRTPPNEESGSFSYQQAAAKALFMLFHGEAIISRSYLERMLPELGLELLVVSDQDDLPQVFVAARKPGSP